MSRCGYCHFQPARQLCGGCKTLFYCDVTCQRQPLYFQTTQVRFQDSTVQLHQAGDDPRSRLSLRWRGGQGCLCYLDTVDLLFLIFIETILNFYWKYFNFNWNETKSGCYPSDVAQHLLFPNLVSDCSNSALAALQLQNEMSIVLVNVLSFLLFCAVWAAFLWSPGREIRFASFDATLVA